MYKANAHQRVERRTSIYVLVSNQNAIMTNDTLAPKVRHSCGLATSAFSRTSRLG